MNRVIDATEVFFDRLAAVHFAPLALAICCHLAKTMCTSRAWRNTLTAAYPEEHVRWRSVWGAYLAGSGVNAVLPARGGDAVKLLLVHRSIPGSAYTTLASSLLVLTIVDAVMAGSFFAYGLTQNVLPSLDVLPDLPSFDFAWFIDHPRVSLLLAALHVVALALLVVWIRRRVDEFRAKVRQGVVILTDRPRYLRSVAFWQLSDWAFRLATIGCFLRAFGVEPSLRNVALVQVTMSLATLVPATPGGIGTEQAFIVYVFRGTVSRSALLAFSVGMKLTLTATNVAAGFAAVALTLRTLDVRRILRRKPAEAIT